MAHSLKTTQMTDLGVNLKSVLMAAKDGALISRLQGDYKLLVGTFIEYRSLGFSNLEDLIRALPQYVKLVRGNDGQTYVKAVTDASTAHIANMVSRQKTSKSKKQLKPSRRISSNTGGWRPQPSSYKSNPVVSQPFNRYNSNQTRNASFRSSSSNNYRPTPQSTKPRYEPPPRHAKMHSPSNTGHIQSSSNISSSSNATPQANIIASSKPKNFVPPQCDPPKANYQHQTTVNCESKTSNGFVSASELKNFNNEAKNSSSNSDYKPPNNVQKAAVDPKPVIRASASFSGTTASSVSDFKENKDSQATPILFQPMKRGASNAYGHILGKFSSMSVTSEDFSSVDHDRIMRQIYQNEPAANTTMPVYTAASSTRPTFANPIYTVKKEIITPERIISPEPVITPVRKKFESCREMVDVYATLRGTQAVYKRIPVPTIKKRGLPNLPDKYLSTLSLMDKKYQSYPIEKELPEEADEEAARKAVSELNITEDSVYIPLPIVPFETSDDIAAVVAKINEIVFPKANGIFSLNVQYVFEEKFKQSLPKDWITYIGPHTGIKLERISKEDELPRFILYPQVLGRESPGNISNKTSSSDNHSVSLEDNETRIVLLSSVLEHPVLKDDNWEIYVSCIKNTCDVVINLVEYTNEFSQLTTNMNQYYENNRHPVTEPMVGEVYAVFSDNNYNRVIIEAIMDDGVVKCDFIDYGDFEVVLVSDLNEMQRQFLDLPIQGISCELSCLEYLAEDELTTQKLIETLLGRIFVAEVTRQEDIITLVVFDTSGDTDINMNEQLLNHVYNESLFPHLPSPDKIVMCFLSQVTDNGDLTIRLEGAGINILQTQIDALKDQLEAKLGDLKETSISKMYAAKYEDGLWYRALTTDNEIKDNKVSVRYIDYGNSGDIDIGNLVELDDLSSILVRLPVQAIVCRLNVQLEPGMEWNSKVSEKLKELAPEDKPLQMKVFTEATAQVSGVIDLFKRTDANELVSINFTLSSDKDLFRVTRRNSVPTPNPFRNKRPNSITFRSNSTSSASIPFGSGTLEAAMNSPSLQSPGATSVKSPIFAGITKTIYSSPSTFQSPDTNLDILAYEPLIAPKIPEVGEHFDITVCLAAQPNNFIVQPFESCDKLKRLVEEMKSFYSSEENCIDMDVTGKCLLKEGSFFAIKHEDGYWYRALVQTVQNSDMVITYLVDYGEFQYIASSNMQPLWTNFRSLPFQAIRASLAGIQPLSHSYNTEDANYFQNLVLEKPFVSVIQSKEPDTENGLNGYKLSLLLIDTSSLQDVYITDLLIENKIAVAKM